MSGNKTVKKSGAKGSNPIPTIAQEDDVICESPTFLSASNSSEKSSESPQTSIPRLLYSLEFATIDADLDGSQKSGQFEVNHVQPTENQMSAVSTI